jgi:hypothetical protein
VYVRWRVDLRAEADGRSPAGLRSYRMIAIAGKSIEGLSWLKAQKMKGPIRVELYALNNTLKQHRDESNPNQPPLCGRC